MDTKQMVEKACRLLEPDLDKILNLPTLDNQSLEKLHMLSDTKKNFLKIEKLEEEKEMKQQMGNSYRVPMVYERPVSIMGQSNHIPMYDYSYDDNRMGNYGYSRGGNDTYSCLEEAMRNARNEQEREEIRQLMSKYHR